MWVRRPCLRAIPCGGPPMNCALPWPRRYSPPATSAFLVTPRLISRATAWIPSRAAEKHLLIRVGEASIHTHLKMEGQWQIYRPRRALAPTRPSSAHHLGHRRLCSSWLFTGNHRDPRTRAGTGGRRTSRTGSARDRLGQFRGRTKSSGCRLRTDRNRAPGSAGDGRTGQRVPKRDLLPTRYPPENADTSRGESRRDSGSVFSHHQRQQVTSHPGHHRRHPPR